MAVELFKTQKGKDACGYKGFSYRIDNCSVDLKRWRCIKTGCTGKLWTLPNNSNPIERDGHNHLPNPEQNLVRKTVSDMKIRARNEATPTTVIYQEAAASVSANPAAAAIFPTLHSADIALYRSRHANLPPIPQRVEDVNIPVNLRQTQNGENFLAYLNENRSVIMFATVENIRRLSRSNHWFMDGTFSVAPALYSQIFIIHALCSDKVVPLVYCILTEKSRQMYCEVFRKLKDLGVDNRMNLSPMLIIIDFETGLIPALQLEFPNARIRGCYFHYCQAIYRKVQLLGLSEQYANCDKIRLSVRLLLALPFVPRHLIEQTFDQLQDDASLPCLLLYQYFQQQWLNTINPGLWNMYDVQRRTNNDAEG